jgi:divalent metal cation (Fe/Co/Zn/Cd) transporter
LKEQKRIILISLITGIVLMLAKFGAYFLTASNFVLTDAAESIVNVIASSFAFFSIYLSSLPRDENHPYGHGKVEFFRFLSRAGLLDSRCYYHRKINLQFFIRMPYS